jgi:hypothetical protein
VIYIPLLIEDRGEASKASKKFVYYVVTEKSAVI